MSQLVSAQENKAIYLEKKEKILEILQETIEFYQQEEPGTANGLVSLKQSLQDGTFGIVVVGEFSAGKSTLLNALMGQQILPSFTSETTATVNFLRHKSCATRGQAATVYYTDDTKMDLDTLDMETIHQYATTKGDNVAQKVAHLDLFLDSPFLEDGVTLVDSPGLNGVAEGHREITQQQILKSHASIFLFSSDHPGTQTDFAFLHELQQKVQTILFVLNKIDIIREEERETAQTVVDTLKANYKKQFPEITTIPEIWPLAAYPALVARNETPMMKSEDLTEEVRAQLEEASRLAPFEARLMRFLTCGEKNRQAMLAPLEKVKELTRETRRSMELEQQALEGKLDGAEIDEEIHKLESEMEGLEERVKSIRVEVGKQVREFHGDATNTLTKELESMKERKLHQVEMCETWEDLCQTTENLESWLYRQAQRILEGCQQDLDEDIRNLVEMQYGSLLEESFQSTGGQLMADADETFHLPDQWISINLEDMDRNVQEKEQAIAALEDAQMQTYSSMFQAQVNQRKREKLEMELENLQMRQDHAREMFIPEAVRYSESYEDKVWRGGLVGLYMNILAGRKSVERTENKVDESARNRALDIQGEILSEVEQKRTNIEHQRDAIGEQDVDRLQFEVQQQSIKIERERQALLEQQAKNQEMVAETYKTAIRKLRNQVSEFCETAGDGLKKQVRDILKKSQKSYADGVCQVVVANVRSTLEKRQQELERLKTKQDGAVAERAKQLEVLSQKQEILGSIMEKTVGMLVEINAQQVDAVVQQSLDEVTV